MNFMSITHEEYVMRNIALTVALIVAPAVVARAADVTETQKILPEDGARWDLFGDAVAIFGNTAVIGARGDDDNGSSSGSAYLFNAMTGERIAKLTARDGAKDDRFGASVGIFGNTAIVGARGDDENGFASGSAYLFDATTGEQIAKFTPRDGEENDRFGASVGIFGNTAIIGAAGDSDNGESSGSAYLFDIRTGEQTAKLLASDGAMRHYFGGDVAISGNTAIVGASGDRHKGPGGGSAYLFDTRTGEQIAKLVAMDGVDLDYFGDSVAISGNIAVVGAWRKDDPSYNQGAAYLFDATTGEQIAKLKHDDVSSAFLFGYAVAISGDLAVIGAIGEAASRNPGGSAYLFDVTSGEQLAKLTAKDAAEGDVFGHSIAISKTSIIVGALGKADNEEQSGAAYVYALDQTTPTAAVPLPAGIWLLSAGLGVLSLTRRRAGADGGVLLAGDEERAAPQ